MNKIKHNNRWNSLKRIHTQWHFNFNSIISQVPQLKPINHFISQTQPAISILAICNSLDYINQIDIFPAHNLQPKKPLANFRSPLQSQIYNYPIPQPNRAQKRIHLTCILSRNCTQHTHTLGRYTTSRIVGLHIVNNCACAVRTDERASAARSYDICAIIHTSSLSYTARGLIERTTRGPSSLKWPAHLPVYVRSSSAPEPGRCGDRI